MLIMLALVPLTITYINQTNYGIWLTITSIVSWFSFFDIGFGNGLRNRFAEAVSSGDYKLASIYVSTTYAILTVIILVVLATFFIVNQFLDWSLILNTESSRSGELSMLAVVVFTFFCLQFIFQLITTILTADQKPAWTGFLFMLGNLLALLLIFVLTKTTNGNLIYLALVMGAAPVFVLVVSSIWLFRGKYSMYRPEISQVNFTYAKNLMSLGLQFFIIQIMAVVLLSTSNIIIAQLLDPQKVTVYNIAFRYFSIPVMGFGIILAPFWTAFTEAYNKSDFTWIKSSVRNLLKIWGLVSLFTFVMILVANLFYRIWVGSDIIVPFGVSALMGVYTILLNLGSIFTFFLNGVGKIRISLYASILMALVSLPQTIFLCKLAGVTGVVLSSCIIFCLNSILPIIQYRKIIAGTATGTWNK